MKCLLKCWRSLLCDRNCAPKCSRFCRSGTLDRASSLCIVSRMSFQWRLTPERPAWWRPSVSTSGAETHQLSTKSTMQQLKGTPQFDCWQNSEYMSYTSLKTIEWVKASKIYLNSTLHRWKSQSALQQTNNKKQKRGHKIKHKIRQP